MSAANSSRSVALERPDKRFATAHARAALVGASLLRTEDDQGAEVFIITKWALTRAIRDIAAVEAWLDRIAGPAT
jgi:hypothetical protein